MDPRSTSSARWIEPGGTETGEAQPRSSFPFEALYRRYHRLLLDHVYRRTGDVHVTEDLVSQTFLSALEALPRYRDRGVPIRFWLLRIATNAVNRWARNRRSLPLDAVENSDPVTLDPDDADPDELRRAQRALLGLPPRYQAVLSLHYLEGLSVADVALVLGWRPGTVKARLCRARRTMRRRLDRSPIAETRS